MKTTKFRGIPQGKNEFVYGSLLNIENKTFIIPEKAILCKILGKEHFHWDYLVELQPETVGQYTGLNDKNGFEIYEGDIVIQNCYPYYHEGKLNYVDTVEWCFAGFHTVHNLVNKERAGISDGINTPLEEEDDFVVIGNIHTTPELLCSTKQ